MYQNFEGLERGEDIKIFKYFWVFPNPLGVLNQKNLFPTLIYQFEHIGTPYYTAAFQANRKRAKSLQLLRSPR